MNFFQRFLFQILSLDYPFCRNVFQTFEIVLTFLIRDLSVLVLVLLICCIHTTEYYVPSLKVGGVGRENLCKTVLLRIWPVKYEK